MAFKISLSNLFKLSPKKESVVGSNSASLPTKPNLPSGTKKGFVENRLFILVFLTVLILSVTVFRQTIINTLKLINDNKAKQHKLSVMTAKANYLYDLDQNQLEKRVRELEQVFPSKKPALELINSLNSLASQDGVYLSSVTLNPGKLEKEETDSPKTSKTAAGQSKLQDFLLEFSVNGDLDKVTKFIKDLERTAPLTKIEDLAISIGRSKEENKTASLRVGLSVRVFYQALPKTIPPVEAPVAHLTAEEEAILDELSVFRFFPLEVSPTLPTGRKEDLFKRSL